MTAKYLRMLAESIAAMPSYRDRVVTAHAVVPTLHAANPRFDRGRFLLACHITQEA